MRATVLLAAVGAEADDLDAMVGRDEAVLLRGGGDPVVEPALLHLDHAVAALAEQVVVMRVAAEPVALLAAVVREDVDDALLAEQRERAVDGGEPGAGVALAEPPPELLRRDVVALAARAPRARRDGAPSLGRRSARAAPRALPAWRSRPLS